MDIHFAKYHGTGNDFILIDNRSGSVHLTTERIESLCHRRFGIGADGLMLLGTEEGFDFSMVYFNSDGKVGSMCGNGGRCITRFAYDLGIHRNDYRFIASDGPHVAELIEDDIIKLKMSDVDHVEKHLNYDLLNTGSPHFIKTVQDLEIYPVAAEGREIRYSDKFKAEGVNVNFVEVVDEDHLFVRTYERGVEDETYSCGTGVTAAALVNAHNERGFNHIDIRTLGGELYVEFDKTGEDCFENIWLCGPAVRVFSGTFSI